MLPAGQLHAEVQRLAGQVANASGQALTLARRAVCQTPDVMGFATAHDAHRWIDTYLLASTA